VHAPAVSTVAASTIQRAASGGSAAEASPASSSSLPRRGPPPPPPALSAATGAPRSAAADELGVTLSADKALVGAVLGMGFYGMGYVIAVASPLCDLLGMKTLLLLACLLHVLGITGFLFAGDFLGLADGAEHGFSAEAIEPSTACRFRRSEYQALIHSTPSLERAVLNRVRHELAAAHSQMLLLGRKTAQERLASFLLDLPSHDPLRPQQSGQVHLPMTRGEIADYLGLTIETVSRVLTKLKTQGVVRLLSLNDLSVLRPERLAAMAQGEV
jgi:CRP/FNR family transcriptional regulator